VVRMGQISDFTAGFFTPQVRIYSPSEHYCVLLRTTVSEVAVTVSNSGTFLVVVGDGYNANYPGAGTYRLTLAQIPELLLSPQATKGSFNQRNLPIGNHRHR